MDENRIDLKAALRELASEESEDIGPHAGLKRLIAYRQGTLPAAEREVLQEHLSLCDRCAGLLLELRDFEAASAGRGVAGPESLRQEAWESLARHLPWKVSAIRPIAGAARRGSARQGASRFFLGAAAALLLFLVGLTVWSAVTAQWERQRLALLKQRLEAREEVLTAARRSLAEAEREASRVHELEAQVAELTSALDELRRTRPAPAKQGQTAVASEIAVSVAPRFALRGQETPKSGFLRGGGVVNTVQIPAQAKGFKVAVSLDDHPGYDEYRLELLDRDRKVLWTTRRPGKTLLGDEGTSVSVSGLGPGRYRLRIEGLHPRGSDLLAEYLLEVVTANPR
ncbi:MAG: anti-sigma factor family protein [Thermoanaerobaculia bacterium]